MKKLLLTFIFCLLSISSFASYKLDITQIESGSDLTAKISVRIDNESTLTEQQLSIPGELNQFSPNHAPFINLSQRNGTYWLNLTLVNPTRKEHVHYIKISDLKLAETNVYQAISSYITPDKHVFYSTTGSIFTSNNATYIRIKSPTESTTLNLIKITPLSDQRIELTFQEKQHYQADILNHNLLQGIFIGILITLVTALLYLYRTSGNYSPLFGAISVSLIGCFQLINTGQFVSLFNLSQTQNLILFYIIYYCALTAYLIMTLYLFRVTKKIIYISSVLSLLISTILIYLTYQIYCNHFTAITTPTFVACLSLLILGIIKWAQSNHIASNAIFTGFTTSALLFINLIHTHGIAPDYLKLGFEDNITMVLLSTFITTAVGKLLFINAQSSNRQYRESKVRRELISAKNSFLAQFSHEMRTPLNGVVGMTELLFDTPLSNNQREYVSTIQESGSRLMTMINDVIDYTRIESGELSLIKRTFDVQSVVLQCLTDFSREAEQKQIELITDISNKVPIMVQGDNERLRQILHGLISHLFNLIEHGEIIVSIEQGTKKDQLKFQIRDTGIGFKSDNEKSLFDAYQQSKTHLKSSELSLDLSMIQELIHLMGGELSLTSEYGKGNIIWFTANMPAKDTENKENDFDDSVLEGLHLLAVDDNVSITKVIAHHAHSWGMETSIAHGGSEALAILRNKANLEERIDVVILDYKMPFMNGIELAAKIKEDNLITNDVLVIMLTGLNFTPHDAMIKNAGIRHILTKPVSGNSLKQSILQGLGHISHANKISNSHPLINQDRHKSLKVLIAEDNQVSTKVICGMLRKLDVSYEVTENGEQAYSAFRDGDFNIILMDCEMPIMDGFEATQAIRDWEKRHKKAEIPIIALSAHVMPQQKAMCIDSGMNDYVEKPIELSTLKAKLNDWAPSVKVITPETAGSSVKQD
jgi:CheY-like chemotaxis protein